MITAATIVADTPLDTVGVEQLRARLAQDYEASSAARQVLAERIATGEQKRLEVAAAGRDTHNTTAKLNELQAELMQLEARDGLPILMADFLLEMIASGKGQYPPGSTVTVSLPGWLEVVVALDGSPF